MNSTEQIIASNHFPAYVLASAGTGKTELIARKVEDLIINQGIDIDRIALITFTNKATSETINRIKEKIYSAWLNGQQEIRGQVDKISMSKISTIHIFCDNIVREYSYEIGLCPNYRISNLTLEKEKLANEVIKNNYEKEIFEIIPMYKIVKLLKDIEEKASDKGIEVCLKKIQENTFWDKLRNYFCRVYPIYKEELEKTKLKIGAITTNDLIKYAVKILKNKHIAPYIVSSLEYLFLDEAQDINYDQAYLTETLITYGVKVFVVGDEKQSIYGFRGSDKNAFNHLIDFIKQNNGIQYKLETNYRSNKFIINKVNNLFSRGFEYKNNKLSFTNQNLVPRDNAETGEESIEIKFARPIDEVIKEIIGKNFDYQDITILCRTNREVVSVYNQLKAAGIPTQSYISKSLYKSKTVVDIVKVLNYIAGGGVLEKAELFYTDHYIASKEFKIEESEFYNQIDNSIQTFKQSGVLSTIIQNIDDCKLIDYYKKIDDKQGLANIQRFFEIIRDMENENLTGMEILSFLNIMIVTEQEETQPQVNQKNSVVVSTIHTFKGLDSNIIVINDIDTNLNKNLFESFYCNGQDLFFNKEILIPSSDVEKDVQYELNRKNIVISNMEEELRVMYVMMTRAKNKIVLCSSKPLNKVKFLIKLNDEYMSYLRWFYKI